MEQSGESWNASDFGAKVKEQEKEITLNARAAQRYLYRAVHTALILDLFSSLSRADVKSTSALAWKRSDHPGDSTLARFCFSCFAFFVLLAASRAHVEGV